MHPYVEKITNLSYEQLKYGVSFSKAYVDFIKFIGKKDAILCTWGNDDIKCI